MLILASRRILLTVHGGVGDLLIVERDARDLHFVPGKGRLDGDVEPIWSALLSSYDEQRPLHRQQRCLADCLCSFFCNLTASTAASALPCPTLLSPTSVQTIREGDEDARISTRLLPIRWRSCTPNAQTRPLHIRITRRACISSSRQEDGEVGIVDLLVDDEVFKPGDVGRVCYSRRGHACMVSTPTPRTSVPHQSVRFQRAPNETHRAML